MNDFDEKFKEMFTEFDQRKQRFFEWVEQKKGEVLREKLQEKGIDINEMSADKNRIFKKFAVHYTPETNAETYYYNDGTDSGLRIVTFQLVRKNNGIGFVLEYV